MLSSRGRIHRATGISGLLALLASLLVLVVAPVQPAGAVVPTGFADELVASGFELPTQAVHLPDGRILVAEKSGLVKVIKNGTVLTTPFLDLRTAVNDFWDRGLVGLVADPSFATNGFVYLFYPQDPGGGDGNGAVTNRLIRVTASGDVGTGMITILGTVNTAGCASTPTCLPQDFYGHGPDSMVFAPDGTLFVSTGDASSWDIVDSRALRSQDVNQYPGKILRITKDGLGVSTNPFWNGDANAIRSKVYAYGFRNPFRISMKPGTSTLYVGDVGWNTSEEVDVVVAGANYGWPCYEGTARTGGYDQLAGCTTLYNQGAGAVRNPLIQVPHNGQGGAIVVGEFTPTSSSFPAPFRDGFFYADYTRGWINFAKVTASNTLDGAPLAFATSVGGPVDIRFGIDGFLYYLDINSGQLRRVRPTTGGGGTTYLSDLTPTGTPVNGWGPYERDRSNGEMAAGDGTTLTIGGVAYGKGLGVHANSDLRYTVPAGCTTFTAQVGLDDEIGNAGDVIFEVWNGTTTRLYQSPLRTGSQGPLAVSVPVSGVGTLRLVVTQNVTNASDHADWADAKLTCGDSIAPVISNIASAPTISGATITWTTNEPSTGQVEYGTTTGYGQTTTLDTTLKTSHSHVIAGLNAGSTYQFRVRSADAATNLAVSANQSFTTTSSGTTTTFLSDLTPTGTPVNGWGPYERDRSNGNEAAGDGTTLTIGGVTYTKGLGVHANSDLRYTVPAGCTTFSAQAGVDDEIGNNGDVAFEVWNGTTTRLFQGTRTGTQGPLPVSVSLTGVSTLRLVVDDNSTAADANWFDHADWADAKFTCGGGTNTPPVPTITLPAAGATFKVGDLITLSGSATDAQDGTLPGNRLTWTVTLQHCPGGVCHTHPFQTYTGPSANFFAPDHGDDSWIDVRLTATDNQGATGSVTRAVNPQTVPLRLESQPSGLQVIYGDQTVTTPYVANAVVGGTRTVSAITPQGANTFTSWSDGGAAQHNITVPTTPLTLTANYSGGGAGTTTTFLSDLTPTGTPVNGWGPYERDRSNGNEAAGDGLTLTIGGVTYTKGLGVHANSDLRYTVPAGCTTFSAQAGVDDEIGNNGDVAFEVWNGTTTRLFQGTRTGTQGPLPVSVSLTGVSTLRLVVDDNSTAADANWFDHADWADAKLTCTGGGGGTSFTFGAATSTTVGINPHSIAVADVDGNGTADAAVANAGSDTVSILRGNGNGTFQAKVDFATADQPKSVVLADLNGDGIRDLVTANQGGTGTISVLRGNGNGTFQARVDYASATNTHEATVGDVDKDGDLDVVSTGWGGTIVSVHRNNGDGTFPPKVDLALGANGSSVALGDLNKDGNVDIVAARLTGASVGYFRGNGNGTFQARVDLTTGTRPHSVRVGDVNADGNLDIVTANETGNSVSVIRGNGNGTFQARTDLATPPTPKSVTLVDIDASGTLDIVVSTINGNYPTLVNPGGDRIGVFRSNGASGFQARLDLTVGQAPFGLAVADVNGDTRSDLLAAGWHDGTLQVRLRQP